MAHGNTSKEVKDVFKVLLSAVISPFVLLLGLPLLLVSQIASKLLGNVVDLKLASVCACGAISGVKF